MERDADDEFESMVDAQFTDIHGGEMSGRDLNDHAERLKSANRANEEPKPYDTQLDDDVDRAVKELKDRAENREKALTDYGRYHELAKRHGTTMRAALDRYTSLEDVLQRNPIHGLSIIARNVGMNPAQVAAGMAQLMSGAHGVDNGADRAAQVENDAQFHQVVHMAAANWPGFRELVPMIDRIIDSREFGQYRTGNHAKDLQTAYQFARQHAQNARQAADVERARNASKSLGAGSGSRAGYRVSTGNEPVQSKYESDLDADVRRAFAQHHG